jgi:hypothetical protein
MASNGAYAKSFAGNPGPVFGNFSLDDARVLKSGGKSFHGGHWRKEMAISAG